MMDKGVMTVISGFSGAGKGTIMKELVRRYPYFLSISATTRKPRQGEVDGREYFFRTREEFEHMIANQELIEWAEYVGNYYGTPRKAVEQQLAEGKDVILEIEMQGSLLVKEKFPDAVLIFITPPSADELKHRLYSRGTETEEEIVRRLAHAEEEASYMRDYDYIVVNDVLDDAVAQIHTIISNEHRRVKYLGEWMESVRGDLARFKEGTVNGQ